MPMGKMKRILVAALAIPPGGGRAPTDGAGADTVIPGATLLAGPSPDPDADDGTGGPGGRIVRILLLVVAIAVIVALVTVLVRTILAR